MAPKLSLRQKQMQSRLREVEKNFINSTTDSAFNRNAKLLNELRTKAKKMGLSVRTDDQLFEAMDTTRKDKLKRGQLAGYSKGVYNPKTKKREFASAIDDPNRYDIVDFADDLSTATMVGGGAALAYKIVKNPKLILELPKNVQAGVRAAYNKLKGNKTMAKGAAAKATQAAIFGKSILTGPAFRAYLDLPDEVQAKLISKISKGKLKTIKGIKDEAEKIQKTLDKAPVKAAQRIAKEALQKTKKVDKPKPPKTSTTPPKPKTVNQGSPVKTGPSSPVSPKTTIVGKARMPENLSKYFGDEKIAKKVEKIWKNTDSGAKAGTKKFTGPNGRGFDLSIADVKQITKAKTPKSRASVISKYGAGAVAAVGYVLGVTYLGKTGGPKTISGKTEAELKAERTQKATSDDKNKVSQTSYSGPELQTVDKTKTNKTKADKAPIPKKRPTKIDSGDTRREETSASNIANIAKTKLEKRKRATDPASSAEADLRDRKAKEKKLRKEGAKAQPGGGPSSSPAVKKKKKSEPKESLKDQFFRQGVRKYGPFTVDSTDRGMSKYGDSENWEELEMEEEMNLRKGGTARRKAFGKGGMYKAPKKTYGMRKGGFTRRGVFR